MKILFILLFLVSCSHHTTLKNVDRELYQMTELQLSSLPESLWPKFKEYKPLVIFNTIEGQYFFGSNRYPLMGFYNYNENHKHPLGLEFQKRIYNTAFPIELFQKHYPSLKKSVFMIDSLERMESLGRKWNRYDWSTIYIHEVFHLFQGPQWSQRIIGKKENIDSEALQKLKNDKENIQLVIDEQKIVRESLLKLDFTKKSSVNSLCNNLINKRKHRYRYINSKIKNSSMNEQFYETLEGTARYIEKHLDLYSKNDVKRREYMNKELLTYLDKYGIKTYYFMLHQIELGESYYYETGFGLSLLLDKLNPNWKKSAFKNTLWEQVIKYCNNIS